ncbi:hypothetical protein, partial [Vibrio cidicii]|uniref:hypothetical protein n=1 Tax=Vibrio cidicii TaxID=1763883 RepID=UPI001584D0CE
TIERVIRQLILHLRVISFTYEKVINRDTNSTSIDACFNCSDSTKHYVKTYEQRYKLVDAFLEMLVSSRDVEAWEKAKENYIKCQKDSKNLFAQENPEMQESLKKHYEGLFG